MFTTNCYACGQMVAYSASECPKCGAKDPAPPSALLFIPWLWRRQLYFPAVFILILSSSISAGNMLAFCVFVLPLSALWGMWKVNRTKRSYKRVAVEQMRIYRQLDVSQRRDFERAAEGEYSNCPEEVRKAMEDIETVDRIYSKPLPFYLSPFLRGRLARYHQQEVAALHREAGADEGNESSTQ